MNKTDLVFIDARIDLELERLEKLLRLRRKLKQELSSINQDQYSDRITSGLSALIQQTR
ncbi:MAG: hypothetical protein ACI9EP_000607 [Oceanospirillaceae bacterium]|jgi:hypothetical protein